MCPAVARRRHRKDASQEISRLSQDFVELKNRNGRARISLCGAEIRQWSVAGRELMWQPDARFWDAVSPILFPLVGWSSGGQIRVDGTTYPMGVHGFAASLDFQLIEHDEASVLLRLTESPETLSRYPFRFELYIRYRLHEGSVEASFSVRNTGMRALPFAIGIHPSFRWPFSATPRAGHRIEFDEVEEPFVPEISPRGLFRPPSRPVPLDGRDLPLTEELLASEALCFLDVRSRGLRFRAPDGCAIRIETEGFPHLALWTRPGAPFLSIESWTGHGDPEGFAGDITEKPSIRLLPAGGEDTCRVRYSFESGD